MRILRDVYCASALIFVTGSAFALDGRGGNCGASLLKVMFNPVLIVITLAVTTVVGSAIAAVRNRSSRRVIEPATQPGTQRVRHQLAQVQSSSQHRVFSKTAIVIGVLTYLLLLVPLYTFSNLCF